MIIRDGFLGIIERPGMVGRLLYCKRANSDGIYSCVINGVNVIVKEGEYMIVGSLHKAGCREVNDYILVYGCNEKVDGVVFFKVDGVIEDKDNIAKELLR